MTALALDGQSFALGGVCGAVLMLLFIVGEAMSGSGGAPRPRHEPPPREPTPKPPKKK